MSKQVLKNWNLICGECEGVLYKYGWESELPATCPDCRGYLFHMDTHRPVGFWNENKEIAETKYLPAVQSSKNAEEIVRDFDPNHI